MVPTLSNKSTPLPTVLIDGMKSAQSRAKHQEKAAAGKKGGGGQKKTKFIKPGYGKYDLDTGLAKDEKIKARSSVKHDPAKAGNQF